MKSEVHTVPHGDGTFQRYQVVSGFEWDDVEYFNPGIEPKSISELVRLYTVNIIGKLPVHTGPFVFFAIPPTMEIPFPKMTEHGYIYDTNVLFRYVLEKGLEDGIVSYDGKGLVSKDEKISEILYQLQMMKRIGIAHDEGEGMHFIPVSEKLGFVSRRRGAVTVNSHFFLMDPTDIDSPYCKLGCPHGLILQKGHVMNPPLNHRTMLLVDRNDHASLRHMELTDMTFMIEGHMYTPGRNCEVHIRPDERVTPKHGGSDIIITEENVVAVKDGGGSVIPCAGFVLSVPNKCMWFNKTDVVYSGMESYKFGSQVGPEMMVEGKMMDHLEFPFYRLGKDPVVYAPTVYPLPYETARAGRICLGTDKNDKPVVIWAEGAGKLGIDAFMDSTGASLLEMAEFCRSMEFRNIINLDGGGSASMTFRGKRYLKIADRKPLTNEECERPVPNGLLIV